MLKTMNKLVLDDDTMKLKSRKEGKGEIGIPKGFFEVCEMRSFLAEALSLM
jgi:hypothetical protein